ncbi:MAG: hypothetical protein JSV36_19640 [Anaerolineae bacterium]|nr:MAG: hypothetical protein JSV36_19640 [Anaerolineae bacterium]
MREDALSKTINYLTATGVDTGLLLNFGPSVEVKRKYKQYKSKREH